MQGGFLTNAVVLQRAVVLELLPLKEETLIGRRDAHLDVVVDLDVGDGVGRVDVQAHRLARRRVLDPDLDGGLGGGGVGCGQGAQV